MRAFCTSLVAVASVFLAIILFFPPENLSRVFGQEEQPGTDLPPVLERQIEGKYDPTVAMQDLKAALDKNVHANGAYVLHRAYVVKTGTCTKLILESDHPGGRDIALLVWKTGAAQVNSAAPDRSLVRASTPVPMVEMPEQPTDRLYGLKEVRDALAGLTEKDKPRTLQLTICPQSTPDTVIISDPAQGKDYYAFTMYDDAWHKLEY